MDCVSVLSSGHLRRSAYRSVRHYYYFAVRRSRQFLPHLDAHVFQRLRSRANRKFEYNSCLASSSGNSDQLSGAKFVDLLRLVAAPDRAAAMTSVLPSS